MNISHLLASLLTTFLLFTAAYAEKPLNDLLSKQEEASSALSTALNGEQEEAAEEETEEFLAVEEAYQISVSHAENGLSINWVIADKYFLYGEQFRFEAEGKTLEATLPAGIIKYDPIFEKEVEKHYQFAQAFIEQDQLPTSFPYVLSVRSQGCADAGLCYPPQVQQFTITATAITPVAEEQAPTTPSKAEAATPSTPQATTFELNKALLMLALAIIGGSILNLMPCVLPVLSLKALSLASSHESHKAQGWSYTLGAVSTFVLIAALLLALRAAGQSVGWGFQLQSPGFVTLLIFLFFVMGLSLSGYIAIGTRWMSLGQNLTQGSGLKQSYFTGVLAAVVASPCTAPFMAPALGFAITQPSIVALSIFAGLGFGMALPLLLLSYLPHLEKWLPKPGAWMETFKQALAFPLYLTAVWLLWVLSNQLGTDSALLIVLGCLLITFIFWLGKQLPVVASTSGILTIIVIAAMSWHSKQQPTITTMPTASEWEPYNEERLQSLRQNGKAVFINLTADWCITCKVNEKLVFTEETLANMKEKGITLVKGDWTNYDSKITHLLEKYGRGGVPLYLLYPAKPGVDATVLPQILSPKKFKSAIEAI